MFVDFVLDILAFVFICCALASLFTGILRVAEFRQEKERDNSEFAYHMAYAFSFTIVFAFISYVCIYYAIH